MSATTADTDTDDDMDQQVIHGSAIKYLKFAIAIANAPRPPVPADYRVLAAQRQRLLSSGEEESDEDDPKESNFYQDEDYQEPKWGATEGKKETDGSLLENIKKIRGEKMNAQHEEETDMCQQIYDLLTTLEPTWDLGESGDPTVMYHKILKNCTFLTNEGTFAEQPELMDKCDEFYKIEERLGNHEHWLRTIDGGDPLILLEKRCRTVRNCLRTARIVITEICNNIAYGTHTSDYMIHTGKFKTFTFSTPALERSHHLNDELITTSTVEFEEFIETTKSSNLKGMRKGDKLNIKAAAVDKLQEYIRQKLAVNIESFCFLSEECVNGERSRRLTDHQIYWKQNNERDFEAINWTKLLTSRDKGHEDSLGVIAKDRRRFKGLLNSLIG